MSGDQGRLMSTGATIEDDDGCTAFSHETHAATP